VKSRRRNNTLLRLHLHLQLPILSVESETLTSPYHGLRAGMTTSAADDGSSLAPTITEGETTADAGAGAGVECVEGKEMKVGAAAPVEEPDKEVAREEDPGDDDDYEEEEEEEEEETETANGKEAELMEPLAALKPGEEVKPEKLEGEKEELDEEPEASEEDPEEVEELKEEGDGIAEEGLVDGSEANGT
jgi:hypothetical protein